MKDVCVMCCVCNLNSLMLELVYFRLLMTSHRDHLDGVKRGKTLSIICLPIEALALTLPPTRLTKSHADTRLMLKNKEDEQLLC